jgi:putative transposase
MLTSEFKAEKQLASLHSQVAQDALHRLDRAFRGFFKKERGYPRFKKFRSYGSFAYPQPYNGSAKLNARDNRIFLSKIGNVRIVVHRRVPSGRRLKTCTIILEPDGRWFASLIYDELLDIRLPFFPGKSSWNAPVGIDLGLSSLITTSDGCKIEHPKFLRRAENKMRLLQNRLSRKRRGSKNSAKARLRLATQCSRVANRRRDYNQKLSTRLAETHDLIVFEDLEVPNMLKNHSLAKSISDAAWGQILRFTKYKANRKGKLCLRVPSAFSTMQCCFCGALTSVTLDMRGFECSECHRFLDRDKNAARIVLMRGIAQKAVGQDKVRYYGPQFGEEYPGRIVPELKPAEAGPPLSESTQRASPAKETGTIGGRIILERQDGLRSFGSLPLEPTRTSVVGGCHLDLTTGSA